MGRSRKARATVAMTAVQTAKRSCKQTNDRKNTQLIFKYLSISMIDIYAQKYCHDIYCVPKYGAGTCKSVFIFFVKAKSAFSAIG